MLKILSNIKLPEFIRWGCVGGVATGIHYGIYYLLKEYLFPNTTFWVNFAYSAGYVISFLCNFFLSAYFTFHEKPSFRKGAGFSVAHLANYGLHILFLNFFMWCGLSTTVAPLLVFAIVVPLNFLMVRFVFRKL